jgi:catechol 2,3-dioxygenase
VVIDPVEMQVGEATAGERRGLLPDGLMVGAVGLTVADLDRSTEFYENVVGLSVRARGEEDGAATAWLSADGATDLFVLRERPDARAAGRHAGLYHAAVLYPSRIELARAAQRNAEQHARTQGASDHGTHEAIYLPDPDGNGLELAADRPREQWPDVTNMKEIAPRPLDMGGLFNLTGDRPPEPRADALTRIGHLHLHVGEIDAALAFYRGLVGFDLVVRVDTAAFVSAGGYHHHLGFNTWKGEGVPASPEDALGMRYWTIELDDARDLDDLRRRLTVGTASVSEIADGIATADPWGNRLRAVTHPSDH